jgi:hypothetical protein
MTVHRHLAGAAVLTAALGVMPAMAQAPAPAVPLQELLKPQELPPGLRAGASGQTPRVIPGMPTAPWGLQLCTTGPGGKQVSIAAPATVDTLLLPLTNDNSLVLSARLYRYRSIQTAQQAWMNLRAAAPQCRGTVRRADGLISTLSSGGTAMIWTENQQRDGSGGTGPGSDSAALYGNFSRHGAVILVTNLSRIGQSTITAAERQGVQLVAVRIGQKLAAQP